MSGDQDIPLDYYTAADDTNNSDDKPLIEKAADESVSTTTPAKKIKKKKKGNTTKPIEKVAYQSLDTANSTLSYFMETFKKYSPGTSALELTQFETAIAPYIPATGATQTISRLAKDSGALAPSSSKQQQQQVHFIVLCPSALRCLALIKSLGRHLGQATPLCKLFARHMKVAEQLAALRSGKFKGAVGTPARVLALLEEDPAVFRDVNCIVVDVERDVKQRSIFEIPETVVPTLRCMQRMAGIFGGKSKDMGEKKKTAGRIQLMVE